MRVRAVRSFAGLRVHHAGDVFDLPAGTDWLAAGLVEEVPEGTPLPADFPGRAALEAAGIDTLEGVESLDEAELVALRGIGKATAAAIKAEAGG